jgi:hypothetical protein
MHYGWRTDVQDWLVMLRVPYAQGEKAVRMKCESRRTDSRRNEWSRNKSEVDEQQRETWLKTKNEEQLKREAMSKT